MTFNKEGLAAAVVFVFSALHGAPVCLHWFSAAIFFIPVRNGVRFDNKGTKATVCSVKPLSAAEALQGIVGRHYCFPR